MKNDLNVLRVLILVWLIAFDYGCWLLGDNFLLTILGLETTNNLEMIG